MIFSRPYIVPIGLCLLIPIAVLTTYLIGVLTKSTIPGFPYISDAGALPPSSCVFGQLLDVIAFLIFLVVIIRYSHVLICYEQQSNKRKLLKYMNIASGIFGVISCFGLTMVGNFQETNSLWTHLVGVFFAFGGLVVYFFFQILLSNLLSPMLYSPTFMLVIRVTILFLSVLAIILTGALGLTAYLKADYFFDIHASLIWERVTKGYIEHVISAVCEWIFVFLLVGLLATFVPDFFRIKIHRNFLNVYLKEKKQEKKENEETEDNKSTKETI